MSNLLLVVSSQEYSGDNSEDLFLEEREAQLKAAAKEKRQQQLAVPRDHQPS